MVNTAEQLVKYKAIKEKLTKNFPKGKTEWLGFTIDISYGGNKEPDIERFCLGGIAGEKEVGDAFLALLLKSADDNIAFWEDCVKRDMKELEASLNK